jgi:hypothetical protein
MICYHTTDAADAILRHGFRDATGSYMLVKFELTGVWLGDSPMDINEGATGDQVLKVEFPDDVDLDGFEVVEEDKPYREWCVPAALINARATVTLMNEDEVDAERERRFALNREDLLAREPERWQRLGGEDN